MSVLLLISLDSIAGRFIVERLKSPFATLLLEDDPKAEFTFSPDINCADSPIKFTNTSTGIDLTFELDFGDNSPKSTERDPSHVFASAVGSGTKTFSVKLTVKSNQDPGKTNCPARLLPVANTI
ncbi:hypothetical protein P872_21315 [Rhodonellum psychrophilum GCM71 = DSM 17998]|uniref:Uncharacterized protein n=2 Tax=Rhodonellum TaxID=336827 RepID=U5BVU6_9BACT|nr:MULTISPECIES: PKD domain-containing protein [Rhodonellum]ERM80721.1 hypothetical protein P872_21315 [Rhodonellum psychrophilum GCM71 = DSM 17998]SDZ24981.1 PKD domain-containing protein [Rhodonellum ikkaensis]